MKPVPWSRTYGNNPTVCLESNQSETTVGTIRSGSKSFAVQRWRSTRMRSSRRRQVQFTFSSVASRLPQWRFAPYRNTANTMRLLEFGSIARVLTISLVLTVIAVGAGRARGPSWPTTDGDDDELHKQARGFFRPLPLDMATAQFPVSPERVNLGRMLFFDPRISDDGTGSCVRCHQPPLYGSDGVPRSIGLHDKVLARNAQTVFNAALNTRQHWDGRFATVEEQAKNALLGPGFGNPDYATAMAR